MKTFYYSHMVCCNFSAGQITEVGNFTEQMTASQKKKVVLKLQMQNFIPKFV